MRLLLIMIAYAGGVFALGMLLHYPFTLLLEAVGVHDLEPQSAFTRLLKLLALTGVWPLLIAVGMNTREGWGFAVTRREFGRMFWRGLVVGVAMIAVLAVALIALDLRIDNARESHGVPAILRIILSGLVGGLLTSFIEETWFRGALYSVIARRSASWVAIAVTAVLYATVHFIKPAAVPVDPDAGWLAGFEIARTMFVQFQSLAFLDSFMALVAAGVLLGLVRLRTGSIAACVGVHVGWIVAIKLTKKTTWVNPKADWSVLVGTYDGVIGYLALAWMVTLCIAYYWRYVRRP